MAELIFFRRGEELMRVSLEHPRLSLGRGPQNDVAVPDNAVSRQQAEILKRGAKFFLRDLSGRGTQVGGESHKEVELQDEAEIALGAWRAVFHSVPRGAVGPTEIHHRLDGTAVQERTTGLQAGTFILRMRSADGERSMTLDDNDVTFGKDEENQVVLNDRFVSSFHARISRTGRGFWLHDLGSTNGTFLNDARVRESEIAPGAVVRIGETEMTIERADKGVPSGDTFEGIVGHDVGMSLLFEQIDRVAPSRAAVAIFGETGTGKELVARAIHARSPRHARPFVAVNCSAISRELMESELFGHEKGAFTGAERTRIGAFEEADGGTLFLDEVGELAMDVQPKLLRALENGEIKRVGSNKPIHVDVRVVAATHRDLMACSRRGQFREDLFYRLCVFPLTLMPLRRRLTDLAMLSDFFIEKFTGSAAVKLTPAARQKLATHAFPGNVRELRNVIHRGLLLRNGPVIDAPQIVFDTPYTEQDDGLNDLENLHLPGLTVDEVIHQVVLRAVRRHGNNRTAAATELGISRSTVIKHLASEP